MQEMAQLLEEHHNYAVRVAYDLTKRWSDAEDLVAEVRYRCIRSAARFRAEQTPDFKVYLRQAIKNTCFTFRKRAIHPATPDSLDDILAAMRRKAQVDTAEGAEEELEDRPRLTLGQQQRLEEITYGWETLTERQRDIAYSLWVEEQSAVEIAAREGVSRQRVMQIAADAQQKILRAIETRLT